MFCCIMMFSLIIMTAVIYYRLVLEEKKKVTRKYIHFNHNSSNQESKEEKKSSNKSLRPRQVANNLNGKYFCTQTVYGTFTISREKKNLTLVCALKILFLVVEGNKILIPQRDQWCSSIFNSETSSEVLPGGVNKDFHFVTRNTHSKTFNKCKQKIY